MKAPFLLLLLFLVFTSTKGIKKNKPKPTKEVFGFVPNHCAPEVYTKFDWSALSTVVWFSESSIEPNFLRLAKNNHVKVLKLASRVEDKHLTNRTERLKWIEAEFKEIRRMRLDGINIDYEQAIPITDHKRRVGLTKLVHGIYRHLKALSPHYKITFDAPWAPNCIDERCYDIKTMSKYLDYYFIMAYDERSQIKTGNCIAGPNSGFQQTLTGLQKFLDLKISPSKLVLGLPWYGRNYACQSLENNTCYIEKVPWRGVNCTDSHATELCYSALSKLIQKEKAKVLWNERQKSPYFQYKEGQTFHQVWFDNPTSLGLKYSLAKKLNLRGVGIWNLGCLDYSNPGMVRQFWNQLKHLE